MSAIFSYQVKIFVQKSSNFVQEILKKSSRILQENRTSVEDFRMRTLCLRLLPQIAANMLIYNQAKKRENHARHQIHQRK